MKRIRCYCLTRDISRVLIGLCRTTVSVCNRVIVDRGTTVSWDEGRGLLVVGFGVWGSGVGIGGSGFGVEGSVFTVQG